MIRLIILLLSVCGLASCTEPKSNTDQSNHPKHNKQHMLSDQEHILQKAKDTASLIHDADEKRRKALEEQDG